MKLRYFLNKPLLESRASDIADKYSVQILQINAKDTPKFEKALDVVDYISKGVDSKYIQFLVKMYINQEFKLTGLDSVIRLIYTFEKYLTYFDKEKRDINIYKSLKEVEDVCDLNDVIYKEKLYIKTKEAKLFYQDANLRIIQPLTKQAAIIFGINGKWCTSTASDTHNLFDSYSKKGKLFYIKVGEEVKDNYALYVTKFPENHRYNQLRDCRDKNVDVNKFKEKYPHVLNLFSQIIIEYRYYELIINTKQAKQIVLNNLIDIEEIFSENNVRLIKTLKFEVTKLLTDNLFDSTNLYICYIDDETYIIYDNKLFDTLEWYKIKEDRVLNNNTKSVYIELFNKVPQIKQIFKEIVKEYQLDYLIGDVEVFENQLQEEDKIEIVYNEYDIKSYKILDMSLFNGYLSDFSFCNSKNNQFQHIVKIKDETYFCSFDENNKDYNEVSFIVWKKDDKETSIQIDSDKFIKENQIVKEIFDEIAQDYNYIPLIFNTHNYEHEQIRNGNVVRYRPDIKSIFNIYYTEYYPMMKFYTRECKECTPTLSAKFFYMISMPKGMYFIYNNRRNHLVIKNQDGFEYSNMSYLYNIHGGLEEWFDDKLKGYL